MEENLKEDELEGLMVLVRDELKVLFAKSTGIKICNKNVDIAKLIEEFAPEDEKRKGIPVDETYKLFDFEKLREYYREIYKKNDKLNKEKEFLITKYEAEYTNLRNICRVINAGIQEKKDSCSVVLKNNLRIIKKEDITTLQNTINELIITNINRINTVVMDKALDELKSNLRRRIYVYLSRFNISIVQDIEDKIDKVMNRISTGTVIKNSITADMDLVLDISEECIANARYKDKILGFIDDEELRDIIEKIHSCLNIK